VHIPFVTATGHGCFGISGCRCIFPCACPALSHH
jgi:hypothetical protein